VSVGGPQSLALDAWACRVADIFARTGDDAVMPYQVGSSVTSKEWRDVDVVVILEDDHFAEWFGTWPGAGHSHDPKWAALCAAISAWGKEETGLPVDFKVQQQTEANARHGGGRSALGLRLTAPDGP